VKRHQCRAPAAFRRFLNCIVQRLTETTQKIFNAKAQGCKGARILKTFAGRFGRHRLVILKLPAALVLISL